jgi:hypothetical protein
MKLMASGVTELGGHHEVALVLAILVVDEDHHRGTARGSRGLRPRCGRPAERLFADERPHAVHVAGDDVATEARRGDERALEVHLAARGQRAQRGLLQGLGGRVRLEEVAAAPGHAEAAAVHGDGLPEHVVAEPALHLERRVAAGDADAADDADLFDDAGEHGVSRAG